MSYPRSNTYRFAVIGRVDGTWSRSHVGSVDDSTLFDSREAAEEAIRDLVNECGWRRPDLDVIELVLP